MADGSVAAEDVAPAAVKARRAKPRSKLRRALQPVFAALLVLMAAPLVLIPIIILVNPPVTTVMLLKLFEGNGIHKDWVPLDDISPRLVRAVMASEDARFCMHHGIDWVEVNKALDDDDGHFRGASTITMQTVKNLFLWPWRSYVRKGLEAPLALYAELFLSKRRIMELYLNIVEFGDGLYGAEAAAQHFFGVSAAQLTASQSARLAAVLPSPATRDAAKPGPGTQRIARRIAGRATGADTQCVLD